jgi:membrane protease YdiL (CAAX protease family)
VVLRYYAIAPSGIGFIRKTALRHSLYGFLLGAVAFIPAYAADLLLARANGQAPGLSLYVSAFSASGNFGNQTGAIFFAICVAGNIINVLMEEGVFRGLFLRLAESKNTFPRAVLLSSVLFGLWHIVGPIREWVDGDRSASGAVMMALVMAITTAITGTKFCLLVKWSGSLWTAMADHFFNNTITNILHVVTPAGADEMMTLRIAIAQLLSLAIVIILFVRSKAREKETFREAAPAA